MMHNEGHVPNVDEMGVVGVKKKQYIFHKKKQGLCDFKGATSRIEKVLFEEFVQNVSALTCCGMNCCQRFPHKKMFLRQEFWNLSFEDRRVYGLNLAYGYPNWESIATMQLSMK
jgi:hypothetical protein